VTKDYLHIAILKNYYLAGLLRCNIVKVEKRPFA
jgi:hypothetical protein